MDSIEKCWPVIRIRWITSLEPPHGSCHDLGCEASVAGWANVFIVCPRGTEPTAQANGVQAKRRLPTLQINPIRRVGAAPAF